jgi:hypothetical protein
MLLFDSKSNLRLILEKTIRLPFRAFVIHFTINFIHRSSGLLCGRPWLCVVR